MNQTRPSELPGSDSTLIHQLDASAPDFAERLDALLAWEPEQDDSVNAAVADIIAAVRRQGDAALVEFTTRFDRLAVGSAAELEVPRADLDQALAGLPAGDRAALLAAAGRIRAYHERQLQRSWDYTEADGTRLGQKITPLDRVGLYVPGGKAAYPSSVLMNALPARVAGVGELIMVVPTPDGLRNAMVLAAAAVAGVDRVFTVGGAQAVAALAFGTQTIPAVDKIVGPGNAYVAQAKRSVFGTVGIDMIAGPSEILVICDGQANPDWVAMDLFSQAEHDELAQSILISPDGPFLARVRESIARLLPGMSRRAVIARSLADRGILIRVPDMLAACRIADRIAPEHLEIIAQDPARWADCIRHAGAMFLGPYASESLGDYCAGPNHVLPTMRTARFSSPLGVYDFQKRSSIIEVSRQGAQTLGRIASTLARAEGLEAHALSAELRVESESAAGDPSVPGDSGAALRAVVRDDVIAMSAYQVPSPEGLLKLDAMENPFRLPETLRQALGERLAQALINRYPVPSYATLKARLRERMEVPDSSGLLLGNGSDELISMICTACARPGAVVLAPVPSFVMYRVSAELAGMRFVGVPLRPDFELDIEAMLAAIRRHQPAVVFIAYPNNPTGNCFDRWAIERILAAAPGLVVLDEAYQPFALDSWLPRVSSEPRLLVMRTLSKLGLAGLRLGYLTGGQHWLEQFDKVRPPYNISVLNEVAGEFALEHLEVLDQQARLIREERERMRGLLSGLTGVGVFASRANFILARVANSAQTHQRLRQAGILVKDVGTMHPLLAHCLRLTIGAPEENNALVEALRSAL
jgi:histidinol dehydrogenase